MNNMKNSIIPNQEKKINNIVYNDFVKIINSENYPDTIREDMKQVLVDVSSNKSIADLYPEVLSEVPMSSSCFQDQCVQYEEHHTPHRKLRQSMLEMQKRLDALDAAKNSRRKSYIKLKEKEQELELLKQYDMNAREMTRLNITILNTFFDLNIDRDDDITISKTFINYYASKVENLIELKEVELDELYRGSNATTHMVKDAILKVIQQKKLAERYMQEVKDSGYSYEESEMVYYVMYFTAESEKQLRTMNRVDTGTFGVIRYLPDGLRKKVLSNISKLKKYIFSSSKEVSEVEDYYVITHREEFLPEKTGDNEIEGVKYKDFVGIDTINILSRSVNEDEL